MNTWGTTTLKKVDKKSIEDGFFCLGKKENKEKEKTMIDLEKYFLSEKVEKYVC